MTITDDSELRVEALFDERYSKQLRPGLRAVGVSVADSDVEIPLMIERVTPESKEALVAVELAPIQGAGMKLTTDSYMRVRLMLDNPEGVLIPISAVTWDDKGETSVMIAEGRFARTRKITIQDQNESKVLVTSGEVKAGELLIVEGQTGLPDGAEVTYKE